MTTESTESGDTDTTSSMTPEDSGPTDNTTRVTIDYTGPTDTTASVASGYTESTETSESVETIPTTQPVLAGESMSVANSKFTPITFMYSSISNT